jgi:putative membrane protein
VIRIVKLSFILSVAVVMIVLAIANRDPVVINLLPADLALWLRMDLSVSLPLFLIIFGAITAGLVLGFVWEWLREHRHRADASRAKRDATRLSRELEALRDEARAKEGQDEILALLEDNKPLRLG